MRFLRRIMILLSVNKNNKKKKQNKNIISVVGASPKAGVTHLSLAIANFAGSVLKRRVIYIEFSEDSKLLSVVGMKPVQIGGSLAYKYKGVYYIFTNDSKEVMDLRTKVEAWFIIDLNRLDDKTATIFQTSDNKIILGFLSEWCQREYMEFLVKINKIYNIDINTCQLLRRKKKTIKLDEMKQYSFCEMPDIENPFVLKEHEFEDIINLVM